MPRPGLLMRSEDEVITEFPLWPFALWDEGCGPRPSRISRHKPQRPNRIVIPTEAQRSGGICSAPLGPPEFPVTNPNTQAELSSRPKRSEVEGSAVRPSVLPNSPLQTPTSCSE